MRHPGYLRELRWISNLLEALEELHADKPEKGAENAAEATDAGEGAPRPLLPAPITEKEQLTLEAFSGGVGSA